MLLAASGGVSACGTQASATPRAEAPTHYEGRCHYLGIEEVAGPTDQNSDSVSLVATYQFGEQAQAQRFGLKFQVARSRIGDLRAHLQAHADVICSPDAQSSGGQTSYDLDLPAFEDPPR
jgi:hypothetical protein